MKLKTLFSLISLLSLSFIHVCLGITPIAHTFETSRNFKLGKLPEHPHLYRLEIVVPDGLHFTTSPIICYKGLCPESLDNFVLIREQSEGATFSLVISTHIQPDFGDTTGHSEGLSTPRGFKCTPNTPFKWFDITLVPRRQGSQTRWEWLVVEQDKKSVPAEEMLPEHVILFCFDPELIEGLAIPSLEEEKGLLVKPLPKIMVKPSLTQAQLNDALNEAAVATKAVIDRYHERQRMADPMRQEMGYQSVSACPAPTA